MNLDTKTAVEIGIPEVPFPMKEIYRRIGMPESAVAGHDAIAQLLEKALGEAKPLIRPRGIVRVLTVGHRTAESTGFIESPFIIRSGQVSRLLDDCDKAVFFMATIGDALENASLKQANDGDVTLAFFLDAIASETADAAADLLHRDLFRKIAEEQGYGITPRFSPGYGDWPVTVQSGIHGLCEGARIGIAVTASSLMIPRKSVSAVFGLIRMPRM
ncbi:hypothetical protein JW948_12290 [bacterium]|nr:hypothetical protein [bacterium]